MAADQSEPPAGTVVAKLIANRRRFFDFLASRVGSREDAEEILQEAFVKGLRKASEIHDDESAVAWFYRLLRNAVTDYYRHAAAGRRALEVHARDVPEADSEFNADLERTVCACINDLIPLLKPEYAEMIRRVDLEGADVASAANALGITPGNARVRLHRARAELRDKLERSCRTCATHGCLDCDCSRGSAPHP